jgi:hypothetical protein
MFGRILAIAALLLAVLIAPSHSFAQGKRVALVVGNSEYKHTPRLENPKNDAVDMAGVLKSLRFDVIEGRDLDKGAMDRKLRDFSHALHNAHTGLFFYAGHGLQVNGQNYLVPIDAELGTAAAIDFELVPLDLVQRTMERESSTNILLVDACRDNPLARNLARALGTRSAQIGRGFAPVESGEGTLIGFSTQPGNVALDGSGRNSPYAAALLKHITTVGDDLPTVLINVRNDVMQATGRRQVPWEHSAMTARFYFIPPRTTEQQVELSFWTSVRDSGNSAVIRTYLDRYPNGEFAPIARALIEQREQQLKAETMARREEERRREDERRAAEAKVAQGDTGAPEAAVHPQNEKPRVVALGPFDGIWRVDFENNAHCRDKGRTTTWAIRNSMLATGGGHRGSVDSTGRLRAEYPCPLYPTETCTLQARMETNRGAGTFRGTRNCGGKFTMTRQ